MLNGSQFIKIIDMDDDVRTLEITLGLGYALQKNYKI
jgi:hypothetical protein